MSDKWRGLHGVITAEAAECEPEHMRLFGPIYDARRAQAQPQQGKAINRATYRPWKKPMIERPH